MPNNNKFSKEIVEAYENPQYYLELMGGAAGYNSLELQPKYARAVKLAKKYCSPINRVLDIGCGRGELVNYYSAQEIHAIGLDFSQTACEIASALLAQNPRKEFGAILNVRDNKIAYPDAYFDVAFMLDVVEHLYKDQLDEYYAQLRRLLRPGGALVIHTWPNRLQRDSIPPQFEVTMRALFALPYRLLFHRPIKRNVRDACELLVHINEHTPHQLFSHLQEHGFKVRVFTTYYSGLRPDSWSDFLGELVLNGGPLGLLPELRQYLNRYIWAVAENMK